MAGLISHNTSFVGRTPDINEITKRLRDPACRLLTLVGMGGMGKTRLSLEVARQLENDFTDGIFVAYVEDAQHLISAISYALDLSFYEQENSNIVRILHFLRSQNALLVLDGFEEHLHEAHVIVDILANIPQIKILITSRHPLNLAEEWLYPVEGLTVPPHADVINPAEYSAIQLFMQRAARINYNLSLDDERADIIELCRVLQGMPLALELAATWTNMLSCAEIITEIQTNLEFLTTSLKNIDERHRNVKGVLEYAWTMLTLEERNALKYLSVFTSWFQWRDVQAITGISLPVLSNLIHKSSITTNERKQYRLHGLIRQYAYDHLTQDADEFNRLHDHHCLHYLEHVIHLTHDLRSENQREALDYIEHNLSNIQAAWNWAVAHDVWHLITQVVEPLYIYHDTQGWLNEFHDILEKSLNKLGEVRPPLQAILSYYYADSLRQVGKNGMAKKHLRTALDLAVEHQVDQVLPLIYQLQGNLEASQSDFENAQESLQKALGLARAQKNEWQSAQILLSLAGLCHLLSDYASWKKYSEQAVVQYQRSGDQLNRARALTLLGLASTYLGEYQSARHHYKQALRLHKKMHNPAGTVSSMVNLGYLWWVEGNYKRAETLQRTSLVLAEKTHLGQNETSWAYYYLALTMFEMNEIPDAQQYVEQSRNLHLQTRNRWGLVCGYVLLSQIDQKNKHTENAQQNILRALQTAQELGSNIPSLMSIEIAGEFLAKQGDEATACALWQFIIHHPSCHMPMRTRCNRLLSELRNLSQNQWTEAKQIAHHLELDAILGYLPTVLGSPSNANLLDIVTNLKEDGLIEALTQRELEVVKLISQGLNTDAVADAMFISVGTVRNHIKSVYRKLDVHSRIQMVDRARDMSLISQ